MKRTTLTPTEYRRETYNGLMKYAGKLEAILLLVDDLESIDYDSITEEQYDEMVTQPAALLFEAKTVVENSAKQYLKDVPT